MRNAPRHIIQRQTVWLDSLGRQPSFGVQERVSVYCRHQLPGLLETLFDRLTDANTTIRLEQLTIDVGTLSPGQLEDELAQRIGEQLEQVLRELLIDTNSNTSVHGNPGGGAGVVRIERLSRHERMAQMLRYFMQNGHLPVWADADDFRVGGNWLQTSGAATFRRELMTLLPENPAMLRRLVFHSTDETLRLVAFGPDSEPSAETIQQLLTATHALTQRALPTIREYYWQGVFTGVTANRPTLADSLLAFGIALFPDRLPTVFFRELLGKLTGHHRTSESVQPGWTDSLVRELSRLVAGPSAKQTGREPLSREPYTEQNLTQVPDRAAYSANKSRPNTTDAEPANPPPTTPHAFTDQPAPSTEPDATPPDPNSHATADDRRGHRPADRNADEGYELFVPLSGVVLLHPFLVTLFSEMGLLTTNRQWVDDLAAGRAVQMLAFLATGQDHCPEFDMPLLKLLCGLPFDAVVSPNMDLTDADRQYAVEFLDAVINHWNALGTVSPDGLRDAFLQREGKLVPADAGWRLTVERRTIDILISRLPWGFSMIKLPFMTDLLSVDWT